jgi:hypothetical protein
MRHWLTSRIDDQNRTFRRQMISIAILIAALQLGALGLLVRAFLLWIDAVAGRQQWRETGLWAGLFVWAEHRTQRSLCFIKGDPVDLLQQGFGAVPDSQHHAEVGRGLVDGHDTIVVVRSFVWIHAVQPVLYCRPWGGVRESSLKILAKGRASVVRWCLPWVRHNERIWAMPKAKPTKRRPKLKSSKPNHKDDWCTALDHMGPIKKRGRRMAAARSTRAGKARGMNSR